MPNEIDPIAAIENEALKEMGLSRADLDLYRRACRTSPSPVCPRPMTARELRKRADEIDLLEQLLKEPQKHD